MYLLERANTRPFTTCTHTRIHNTKHRHTNMSAKHHITTNIFTKYQKMSNALYTRISWKTQHTLSSDHIPIITTINIRYDYRLEQNTNIHIANRIFTNIILMPDKYNIPKVKMPSNCRLLPNHIVCKETICGEQTHVIQLSNS